MQDSSGNIIEKHQYSGNDPWHDGIMPPIDDAHMRSSLAATHILVEGSSFKTLRLFYTSNDNEIKERAFRKDEEEVWGWHTEPVSFNAIIPGTKIAADEWHRLYFQPGHIAQGTAFMQYAFANGVWSLRDDKVPPFL